MSQSITINGQKINIENKSSTGATSLYLLGLIFYSRKQKNDNFAPKIELSRDDLFDLNNHIESAKLWINESINAVGQLMTDISYEEIDTPALKNIGYLIAGLAELQSLVKQTDDMMPLTGKEES